MDILFFFSFDWPEGSFVASSVSDGEDSPSDSFTPYLSKDSYDYYFFMDHLGMYNNYRGTIFITRISMDDLFKEDLGLIEEILILLLNPAISILK